jgi:hypothetical protein
MGLALVGFFLGCQMLVIVGVAVFVWVESPARFAVRYKTEEKSVEIMTPQPLQVTPADTKVKTVALPTEAYLTGVGTNPAVWSNGRAFESSWLAACEIVRSVWRLGLLGAGMLVCWLLAGRYCRVAKAKPESKRSVPEPIAAPTSGPEKQSGNSVVGKQPPSVG